ncbi:hypothetical protein BEI64_03895 [Eisenbergiella tayi]|uniref:Uncharacterized protein n=1 Tax=Eisenbergiella tayi TaxID=1432052 RepID=A0ABX3ADE3_9FIRM|nr:hypothetical protein BEI62_27745 [Eisenbergiella tayi]ODR53252.1 hypothetical protein BEI63_19000 [Eisenbergiella tayi]ODR62507.1 hypothetical protein BEI64_03895 [Eisenbergiella tayi]
MGDKFYGAWGYGGLLSPVLGLPVRSRLLYLRPGGVSGYRAAESLPWQSQTKKGAVSNCFVPMFHCQRG